MRATWCVMEARRGELEIYVLRKWYFCYYEGIDYIWLRCNVPAVFEKTKHIKVSLTVMYLLIRVKS